MPNKDTVELLKECNAGAKTAVNAFDEVLPAVKSPRLKEFLQDNKQLHVELGNRCHEMLNQFNENEKDPALMADAMSWAKINFKMLQEPVDQTVADLMTDGCNMGIKSLWRYLNQYAAAGEEAKKLTKELIDVQQQLLQQLHGYL